MRDDGASQCDDGTSVVQGIGHHLGAVPDVKVGHVITVLAADVVACAGPSRVDLPNWKVGGVEVSTEVLERPELKDADTGPEMFHYVRKEKIAESAVMGNFVVALCGETFPVTKAAKPGSPVCPKCKEIYESWGE